MEEKEEEEEEEDEDGVEVCTVLCPYNTNLVIL